MGKALVETFPVARAMIERPNAALQMLQTPPSWSLLGKLAHNLHVLARWRRLPFLFAPFPIFRRTGADIVCIDWQINMMRAATRNSYGSRSTCSR
jgi:hypothetical protein